MLPLDIHRENRGPRLPARAKAARADAGGESALGLMGHTSEVRIHDWDMADWLGWILALTPQDVRLVCTACPRQAAPAGMMA